MSVPMIFIINRDGTPGTAFEVHRGKTYRFGRGDDCEVRIRLEGVSHFHCKITEQHNVFWLVPEKGVTNPSTVNGKPLTGPHPLRGNDIFTIGPRMLKFMVAEDGPLNDLSNTPRTPYQEIDPSEVQQKPAASRPTRPAQIHPRRASSGIRKPGARQFRQLDALATPAVNRTKVKAARSVPRPVVKPNQERRRSESETKPADKPAAKPIDAIGTPTRPVRKEMPSRETSPSKLQKNEVNAPPAVASDVGLSLPTPEKVTKKKNKAGKKKIISEIFTASADLDKTVMEHFEEFEDQEIVLDAERLAEKGSKITPANSPFDIPSPTKAPTPIRSPIPMQPLSPLADRARSPSPNKKHKKSKLTTPVVFTSRSPSPVKQVEKSVSPVLASPQKSPVKAPSPVLREAANSPAKVAQPSPQKAASPVKEVDAPASPSPVKEKPISPIKAPLSPQRPASPVKEKSPIKEPASPVKEQPASPLKAPTSSQRSISPAKTPASSPVKAVAEEAAPAVDEPEVVAAPTPAPEPVVEAPTPVEPAVVEEKAFEAKSEPEVDYESMKVTELKALLKKRGISVTGNKKQLVAALVQADSEQTEAPAAAAPAAEPSSKEPEALAAPAPEVEAAPAEEEPAEAEATKQDAAVELPSKAPADMIVRELKEELTKRGLDTTGTKAVLVKRLEDALALSTAEPAKEEAAPTVTEAVKEPVKEEKVEEKTEPAEPEAASKSESAWADMTVVQLKAELKRRKLDDKGKKSELVARLEESESEQSAGSSSSDKENTSAPAKINYKEWTVRDLQAELKKKGLEAVGKKADLVARLEAM